MGGKRKHSERKINKARNTYKEREKTLAERYKLRKILRLIGILLTAAALGASMLIAWYLPLILYALIYGNSLQLKNRIN